jgi:hypothetical protein
MRTAADGKNTALATGPLALDPDEPGSKVEDQIESFDGVSRPHADTKLGGRM